MKNLMNGEDTSLLISRLNQLHTGSTPLWGRMNIYQMVVHAQKPFDVYFGDLPLKRGLIGWLFGGLAKKSLLSEKPMARNLPTMKEFKVVHQGDVDQEKGRLASMIHQFTAAVKKDETHEHPLFGKMNGEEWGILLYKHTDHHLQQFGV